MFSYTGLGILQFVVLILAIAIGIAWLRQYLSDTAPQRLHQARKYALSSAGTIHDEELTSVKAAYVYNLQSTGVPSLQAGGFVDKVPNFDPRQEGWETRREVITTSRAIGYTKAGANPMDLIELDGDYMLIVANAATFLYKTLDLTAPEADALQEERNRACKQNDTSIDSFMGSSWTIKGAYGDNQPAWRRPGDRACSYIQVLSVHPNLGEAGRRSTLPSNLLDGKVHDYYDLRAFNTNDPKQRLYFFYTGGKWSCYVGHQLSPAEANAIAGI